MKTAAAAVLLLAAIPSLARAQGTEAPGGAPSAVVTADSELPGAKAAKELVQRYLAAVKAKKWVEVKRFLHPGTVAAIAERKKRLGREDHPMAPWFHEKVDSWLKDFKVLSAQPAPLDTFVVETSEDNYQVEERGVAEGERASYLVGKKDGRWYVVDKKRGETFTRDSVKLGYKGWFDRVEKPEPAPDEAAPAE
jgi:hypothetical protein